MDYMKIYHFGRNFVKLRVKIGGKGFEENKGQRITFPTKSFRDALDSKILRDLKKVDENFEVAWHS